MCGNLAGNAQQFRLYCDLVLSVHHLFFNYWYRHLFCWGFYLLNFKTDNFRHCCWALMILGSPLLGSLILGSHVAFHFVHAGVTSFSLTRTVVPLAAHESFTALGKIMESSELPMSRNEVECQIHDILKSETGNSSSHLEELRFQPQNKFSCAFRILRVFGSQWCILCIT